MIALVWDGAQARVREDVPQPAAGAGMALVRVRLAGICSTDLEILSGYMGFRGVLGHEFVGVVADGPAEIMGRRVVGEINFACGRCPTCAAGRRRHCPSRTVMGILAADGAFAELVRVPVENLHRIPSDLPEEAAVFVEPLAAAFEAAEQTRGLAGGRSLVIGAGKLGFLIAQVLAARGDDVAVVARRQRTVDLARRLRLSPVAAATAPRSWDLVVDATGDVAGFEAALRAVRPLGTIVLKSTLASLYRIDLSRVVIDELSVIGSRCGEFPPAIAALAAGQVEVTPLVEATFPLRDALPALRRAAAPGALKILLAAGR